MGQGTEELTSQIEDTRRRMAGDLDTLQDKVSPSAIVERRKQAVRGRIASVKEKVMGTASNATSSVGSAASSVGSAASSVPSAAGNAGANVASTAQQQYEGAPLAAGLVAFGAGVVLASLLPATRPEAEVAHRVVETVGDQGLVDQAKAAGQELVGNVRDSATEAAQQVTQTAQQSAQAVKDEGQSSAEAVRDQATS